MTASLIVRLEAAALDPGAELDAVIAECGEAGGVVSFTGVARATGKDGAPVETLRLDWYPGMTERSMRAIAEAAASRFDVTLCAAIHRCGDVPAGAPVVFAAAASRHRREAFLAADFMMDLLKTEAVFWKQEIGPDGARWIEPSERDRADAARWRE